MTPMMMMMMLIRAAELSTFKIHTPPHCSRIYKAMAYASIGRLPAEHKNTK
jgi:hypothetical protein